MVDLSFRPSTLRRLAIAIVILYVASSFFGGIGLGEMGMHPGRRPIPEQEKRKIESEVNKLHANLGDVSIKAADGAILRAWFVEPALGNGNAVILLHGVSDNRLGMVGYGTWLLKSGYSILLPDARAHGLSDGKLATYGLKEADDIHGWVSWLENAHHSNCVFGFGESMGAGQILQALSKEQRFCAVVAESPFESFREVSYARFGRPFHAGPWLGRTFFWPTDAVGFLYVRLRYGVDMDLASPKNAVAHSNVPVFLIHGTDDRNIPSYNSADLEAANSSKVVLWLVPHAVHCGARSVAPEEFDRRILEWFHEHSKEKVDQAPPVVSLTRLRLHARSA